MGENKGRNYSWAIFLVLVGVLFLLNTTNVIGWGIWLYIVRFWPVLVILFGLKIILGNSLIEKTLEVIFTILLTLFVFIVAYVQYTNEKLDFLPKSTNEWILRGGSGIFNLKKDNVKEEIFVKKENYEGIERMSLILDIGAGNITINEKEEEKYIDIFSDFPKVFDSPVLVQSKVNNSLNLEFKGATTKRFNLFPNESNYDITLGLLELPTTLDIVIGAGSGEVLLDRIPITDFYAKVGAGDLDISFGNKSVPSGDIFLNVGAGEMKLTLPQRVGYEIEYDLGIGNMKIEGEDLVSSSSNDGTFESVNFEDADNKIKIVLTVGVGSFTLERY